MTNRQTSQKTMGDAKTRPPKKPILMRRVSPVSGLVARKRQLRGVAAQYGLLQDVQDLRVEDERAHAQHQDGRGGHDEAVAQLGQVLGERHARGGVAEAAHRTS